MNKAEIYEEYPHKIAILSLSFTIATYGIGTVILAGFGILWGILFALYCIGIEIWVLKKSCVNCYYYGKICGLGKGKLCAKFFKQGESQKFIESEVSWKMMIPDFLTIIFPIIGAIVLLVFNFTPLVLILLVALMLLYFIGNALIRGRLTCNHCKQRELGCPAAKLFMEKQK